MQAKQFSSSGMKIMLLVLQKLDFFCGMVITRAATSMSYNVDTMSNNVDTMSNNVDTITNNVDTVSNNVDTGPYAK